MASEVSTLEIITTKNVLRCRMVMQQILSHERPVAVDAEGICLSAKGRMTLLQICTSDKVVYLIDLIDPDDPDDVEPAKILMKDGRVKAMLESSRVTKVMHACKSDSAALYHQFDVRLHLDNVFDTQAADMAVRRKLDGEYFLKSHGLNTVAEEYGCKSNSLKDAHAEWVTEDKDMWAVRPLSKDMIAYAAQDVTVLIPEMYNILRRKLDHADAHEYYREVLDDFMHCSIQEEKERVRAQRESRDIVDAKTVLEQIIRTHRAHTSLDMLSEVEERALMQLQVTKDPLCRFLKNSTIAALEEKLCLRDIEQWEQQQEEDPKNFRLKPFNFSRLKTMGKHSRRGVRETAQKLRQKLFAEKQSQDILDAETVLEEMIHAHQADTSLDALSEDEEKALLQLQVTKDPLCHFLENATVAALEEKICLRDLPRWKLQQEEDPENFTLNTFNSARLKTMAKHARPGVREPARDLRQKLFAQKESQDILDAETVLDEMTHARRAHRSLDSLSHDEERALLQLQATNDPLCHFLQNATVATLEERICLRDLHKWELQQKEDPQNFRLNPFNYSRLKTMSKHSKRSVRQRARRLREELFAQNQENSTTHVRPAATQRRRRR